MDAEHLVVGPFERGTAHFDESDLFYRHLSEVHPTGAMLVDVGAHHGGSITSFCNDGWTVHAFEPDPNNRKRLKNAVQDHWKLTINEEAVAETDGETVDFFTSSESTGVSGLSAFLDSHEKACQVETVRLSTYLAANSISHVNYLKVDTEGHDLFVLRSFPWDTDAPDAIECEFEDNKTLDLGYTSDELAQFLIEKGYDVLVSEWHPIIRYGISHDFKALRRYVPGTISGDSWGNFLAVRSGGDVDRLIEHARTRGVDIRDRDHATPAPTPAAAPAQPATGAATFPAEFPDSPSAVPAVAGQAEIAAAHAAAMQPPAARKAPAAAAVAAGGVAVAATKAPGLLQRELGRMVKFYTAKTGLVLLAGFVMVGIGLVGFAWSWVIGLLGLALIAIFLAYRFDMLNEKLVTESVQIRQRVNAARQQADTSRKALAHVHQELRESVERLETRLAEVESGQDS